MNTFIVVAIILIAIIAVTSAALLNSEFREFLIKLARLGAEAVAIAIFVLLIIGVGKLLEVGVHQIIAPPS